MVCPTPMPRLPRAEGVPLLSEPPIPYLPSATAIGGRMKYLVDSPEEIWGCLDTLEYLEVRTPLQPPPPFPTTSSPPFPYPLAPHPDTDTPPLSRPCLAVDPQAAWRYLRALEVHKLLTSPSGSYVKSGLMRRFPLLRHQWPTVEKFRQAPPGRTLRAPWERPVRVPSPV